MNLNFDLSGPFEDPPKPTAWSAQRRLARKLADVVRRRQVAGYVDEINALTAEERRNAARIHQEFCDLTEGVKRFAGVPAVDRVTTIAISGPTLVAKTEGDILPEAYTLWLVDQQRWLEEPPQPKNDADPNNLDC